jgi:hypothetical protein
MPEAPAENKREKQVCLSLHSGEIRASFGATMQGLPENGY